MSGQSDPYKHHPELRGKIADPLASRFRQMDIAAIDQRMKSIGEPTNWRRSDEEREASRLETLRDHLDSDVWLFGYGSLIWDPAIRFDEVRIGCLKGFHRRFCLRSELGRGSPENPGLMVGLDQGGECQSLAFRIPNGLLHEETRLVWQREMLRQTYEARFVPVETGQGNIMALTFIVDPRAENYLSAINLEEAARYVATGKGMYGSSLEYVQNLVRHLDEFGIEDSNVRELHDLSVGLAKPDSYESSQ